MPDSDTKETARPYVLAEQTHHFIRQHQWQVGVLPFGATEPHNFHMPYGTDNYQLDVIGDRACRHAYERGAKVLLLPTVPFGVNTNYLEIPGGLACSMTPMTLLHVLSDIVDSMQQQGIRKLVLLNGHGGNELKPLIRQLHHKTEVFLCVCNWYEMVADRMAAIFEAPGEHADEMETSLGLAYFPQFLRPELADDGAAKPTRFEAIDRGWVSITRPWHLATASTGVGNPKAASADKGEELMTSVTERLGDFLVELANAEIDETFPFRS